MEIRTRTLFTVEQEHLVNKMKEVPMQEIVAEEVFVPDRIRELVRKERTNGTNI